MSDFIKIFSKGEKINWLLIRKRSGIPQLHMLSKDYKILGISSNKDFPKGNINIFQYICGWLHCFRNPEDFDINIKNTLLSESDFVEINKKYNTKKKYDYFYVCQDSSNQMKSKNFKLFLQSLEVLNQKNLTGVVIGLSPKNFKPSIVHNITFFPFLTQDNLFSIISKCRFGYFPNEKDASPRCLTESLCLNVPVLVNDQIYGGWKYVNNNTGAFFKNNLLDLKQKIDYIMNEKFSCSEYYYSEFGPKNSNKKLLSFIRSLDSNFQYDYISLYK
jgi:glycosyltransferase involved in cell wall biosynthesis